MRKMYFLLSMLMLSACGADNVVTLYKKGLEKSERIHVATFDTVGGAEANNTSCVAIAILLEQQDVMNKYWCEKGSYKN